MERPGWLGFDDTHELKTASPQADSTVTLETPPVPPGLQPAGVPPAVARIRLAEPWHLRRLYSHVGGGINNGRTKKTVR